jgi:hypothetical protein
MSGILGFVYAALVGLMTIMVLFLYYFANLDIAEFAHLSFCQNCGGKLSKCLPYLIVLGHLTALVLIIAQLFMVYAIGGCKDACHYDAVNNKLSYNTMQEEAEILIIVCIVSWVVMHSIGGFFRRNVYYDSFFYQPEDKSNKFVLWCCIRCGP